MAYISLYVKYKTKNGNTPISNYLTKNQIATFEKCDIPTCAYLTTFFRKSK